MEKFFEVKGSTFEKAVTVFLKVLVIPILIVLFPTAMFGKNGVLAIALAAIYLFVFYFKAHEDK